MKKIAAAYVFILVGMMIISTNFTTSTQITSQNQSTPPFQSDYEPFKKIEGCNSDVPIFAWIKYYDIDLEDHGIDVHQTDDDGYILLITAYGEESDSFVLVKLDAQGNEEWIREYPQFGDSGAYKVLQTSDHGYAIAGFMETTLYNMEPFFVKTDELGYEEWNKTYGYPVYSYFSSFENTEDGGYVITGRKNNDCFILKTDNNGIEEWNTSFGGPYDDYGVDIKQTQDLGYIITGTTSHYPQGCLWLLKLNNTGNELWNKTYHDTSIRSYASAVVETSDGGLAGIGTLYITDNSAGSYWIVRTNSEGEELWNNTYLDDCAGIEIVAFDGDCTDDGGFVLFGYVAYSGSAADAIIVRTNNIGGEEWKMTVEVEGLGLGFGIEQTNDKGFIFCGLQMVPNPFEADAFIGRLINDQAPLVPSNPLPANNSDDITIDPLLEWTCSDPDGDPLTFDVYFGTSDPPEQVTYHQSEPSYNPSILNYTTQYFWKIVAYDGKGAETEGPVWTFETREEEWINSFMVGQITNLSQIGDIATFEAVKLRTISLRPFQVMTYSNHESIFVKNQYIGIVDLRFTFAYCKILF
jgi:hypothetical protein